MQHWLHHVHQGQQCCRLGMRMGQLFALTSAHQIDDHFRFVHDLHLDRSMIATSIQCFECMEMQEERSFPWFPENANAVEFGLPFTTTSFAVALLLVFRTNEAYRRYVVHAYPLQQNGNAAE